MSAGEHEQLHTYLIVSKGSQRPQIVVWDTAKICVGRHHEQDIVLEDREASRRHALLRRDGAKFTVEDLGTSNGTFVNADPIHRVELHPNDSIRIGEYSLRFCQSSDDPMTTMTNVVPASRLRRIQPLSEDSNDSTMLELPPDDDALWNPGSQIGGVSSSGPVVRDLDDELSVPVKDDSPEFGSPDDPDPLMASAFDLGTPLPPVGRSLSDSSGTPPMAAREHSPTTAPTFVNPLAVPGGSSVEVTLQLDGVDPELLRTLQALLGRRFDLSALSVFLKALSIR